MKRMFGLLSVCALFAGFVVAAETVKSGLPVGEDVPAFYVTDITGPSAGKAPLCYRCKYSNRPVVTIFTHKVDENITSLVAQIDKEVGAHKDDKMAAFLVLLSDKPKEEAGKLKDVAKKAEVKNTPLTTYEDSEGPAGYKLSKDAETTVMMWVEGKVKVNHAFAKGQLDKKAVEAIVADTKKILN
ncbi:MAG: hypothetical protein U0903_00445 [Planctomycetales bacterium]